MESWQLYKAAIEAIDYKKVAMALGLKGTSVYRLAQPVLGDEHPDGSGVRNDLDRIEMLVDVLAAHPSARPCLRMMRLHFEEMFARALDHAEPESVRRMTDAGLAERFSQLMREENSAEAEENERQACYWRDGDLAGLAEASRREIEKEEELIAVAEELIRRKIDPRTTRR